MTGLSQVMILKWLISHTQRIHCSDLLLFYRLHPKNCLGVRQFAETMMCTTLYDAANSFVHQHFVEVSMSEEFLTLRPEEVLELVGCDELNVQAEEQVRVSGDIWWHIVMARKDVAECIDVDHTFSLCHSFECILLRHHKRRKPDLVVCRCLRPYLLGYGIHMKTGSHGYQS